MCLQPSQAFVVPPPSSRVAPTIFRTPQSENGRPFSSNPEAHAILTTQRRSVANIQTQGLFGLGGPEIAIILVAAAFLVGPEKIGSMVGKLKDDLDDVPDEFKKIPAEFQKGLEEGEQTARARNAKRIDPVPDDELDEK
eukprot:scaffold11830_cov69-Cylindrotheca_fusiformis.AAC.1